MRSYELHLRFELLTAISYRITPLSYSFANRSYLLPLKMVDNSGTAPESLRPFNTLNVINYIYITLILECQAGSSCKT
jgi:hypothetical protein